MLFCVNYAIGALCGQLSQRSFLRCRRIYNSLFGFAIRFIFWDLRWHYTWQPARDVQLGDVIRKLFLDLLGWLVLLWAGLLRLPLRGLAETLLLELDPRLGNLYLVQGLYVLLAVDPPGLAFL